MWKSIKDYENIYEVSNLGNVRSLDRYCNRSDGIVQFKKGRIIKQIKNDDGYLQCKLCKNGNSKTIKVHRIVAETFIPNPNNFPEVNHIDCNRKNNCVENLEWCTHIDNVLHSTLKGHYKKPYGENNPNYRNTKLKHYYELHPEDKQKLSRKGSQNGKAHPVCMIYRNTEYYFSYVGECVKYLIDNNIVTGIKSESLHTRILEKLKTGKEYKGLTFLNKIKQTTSC